MLSCLINFPSNQSDFKTEMNDVTRSPLVSRQKKLEKGYTCFGNVFSIYLTTKTMALHMHFNIAAFNINLQITFDKGEIYSSWFKVKIGRLLRTTGRTYYRAYWRTDQQFCLQNWTHLINKNCFRNGIRQLVAQDFYILLRTNVSK